MTQLRDIIVIGAALNGLAAALALGGRHVKRPLDVTVVDLKDPRGFASNSFDGRASAITAAARRMFEALGVWQRVAHEAQAMADIIVTDSATPGGARPVLLQFGPDDMRGGPSSHMIENRHLYAALLAEARAISPHPLRGGPCRGTLSFRTRPCRRDAGRWFRPAGQASSSPPTAATLRRARRRASASSAGPMTRWASSPRWSTNCRIMAGPKSISRRQGPSPSCRCPATGPPSSGRNARKRLSACWPCRSRPSRRS